MKALLWIAGNNDGSDVNGKLAHDIRELGNAMQKAPSLLPSIPADLTNDLLLALQQPIETGKEVNLHEEEDVRNCFSADSSIHSTLHHKLLCL